MSGMNAMTGFPGPCVVTQAVGIPATPRSIWKFCFSRMPATYREVSNSWKAEFAEAEDLVDHLLRHGLHFVDFGDGFGLKRR